MNSRSPRLSTRWASALQVFLGMIVAVSLLSEPLTAGEAVHRAGQSILVSANETIDGDLFCVGESITILGDVKGDLFAMGRMVRLEGSVDGSVHVVGETIELASPRSGSCRLVGGLIDIERGSMSGDLRVATAFLRCRDGVSIEGGLAMVGGVADLAGTIQGSVLLAVSSAELSGQFLGPIEVRQTHTEIASINPFSRVIGSTNPATQAARASSKGRIDQIRVSSSAVIKTGLMVRGAMPPLVEEGATLSSPVMWMEVSEVTGPTTAARWRSWLGSAIGFVLAGSIFSLLFPTRSRNAMRHFGSKPLGVAVLGPVYWILLILTSSFVLLSCISLGVAMSLVSLHGSLPFLIGLGCVGTVVVGGGGALVGIWVSPTLLIGWILRSVGYRIPGFRGDAVVVPSLLGGLITAGLLQIPVAGFWIWATLALYGSGVFLLGAAPPPMPPLRAGRTKPRIDRIR